jgi:hypothetical protein
MRKILIWTLLVFGLPVARAEERKPIADAGTVTCDSPGDGGVSKWVTSKSGLSAAVELQVKISGEGKQRHCITSWRLHLRGKDGRRRVIAVAGRDDRPDDEEWIEENSFEIEAWSSDGQKVLVSQIEAHGDWDETTPIVFDFTSNSFHRVELYSLFKKLIPGDCYVVYRALRFSEDGNVLLSAMSTDDDREAGTKACFPESLWKLDFRKGAIARVGVHIR